MSNLFTPLGKSYLNISGQVYDADFISLATINDDKLAFDKQTVFLKQEEKEVLNQQEIKRFDQAVYLGKYRGVYSLVCDLDISWYNQGNIKIHELVLPDTVQGMVTNYYDYNAEASQVTLVHEHEIDYDHIISEIPSTYHYLIDEVEVYVYTQNQAKKVLEYFKDIHEVFVADGHHRIYSTSLSDIKKSNSVCLMNLADAEIKSIDRVLPHVSQEKFEKAIEILNTQEFKIDTSPLEKGIIEMHYAGKEYSVHLKELENNTFKNNDIYRLNTQIVSLAFRVFNTSDLKYFVDCEEANQYLIENKDAVRFKSYPVHFSEFTEIVRDGKIMPPKSTFFYPKFPSFLIFKSY